MRDAKASKVVHSGSCMWLASGKNLGCSGAVSFSTVMTWPDFGRVSLFVVRARKTLMLFSDSILTNLSNHCCVLLPASTSSNWKAFTSLSTSTYCSPKNTVASSMPEKTLPDGLQSYAPVVYQCLPHLPTWICHQYYCMLLQFSMVLVATKTKCAARRCKLIRHN